MRKDSLILVGFLCLVATSCAPRASLTQDRPPEESQSQNESLDPTAASKEPAAEPAPTGTPQVDEPVIPPVRKAPSTDEPKDSVPTGILGKSIAVGKLVRQAEAAYANQDTEQALATLDRALEILEDDEEVHRLRARIFRSAGRLPEALAAAKLGRRFHPRSFGLAREEVETRLAQKKPELALLALRGTRLLAKDAPEIEFLAARLEAQLGRGESSVASLGKAARAGFADTSRVTESAEFAAIRQLPSYTDTLAQIERNQRHREEVKSNITTTSSTPEAGEGFAPLQLQTWLRQSLVQGGLQLNFSFTSREDVHYPDPDDPAKYRVIFAWADWSARSNEMLENIVKLDAKYRERGLRTVVISPDFYDGRDEYYHASGDALKAKGIDLAWYVVSPLNYSQRFRSRVVPATFFVNAKNEAVLYAPGVVAYEVLDGLMAQFIANTEELERQAEEKNADESNTGEPVGSEPESEDSETEESPKSGG